MAAPRRIKGIDCGGPAVAGIRRALTERFAEMSDLRGAALKWKDPEGVHSMRVASRRLRSALSDFTPYMNKRSLSSTTKQIRSIADALGEVRDQDVAIAALETLASQAPDQFTKTLQKLVDARKKIRRVARQELKRTLPKARMKNLSSDFGRAVTLATERKQRSTIDAESDDSYRDVAKAIIHDRLSELEKLSSSLYEPLEAKQLHEMRIAAKRLRYAIQLFEGCWSSSILLFAKNTARLQSALGSVHDCDVWLQSFREEILESKRLDRQEQTKSFLWLFTHFNELRNLYFQEAFSLWNAWETDRIIDTLKKALKN